MSNRAAYLLSPKSQITLGDAPTYIPGPGEILVKNTSLSFNPLESQIQQRAIIPLTYPAIIGNSFAGTIISLGPKITNFKIGDHVGVTRNKLVFDDSRFGAFQKFALAKVESVALLDGTVEEEGLDDASAVMINIASVVAGVSVFMGLGLPFEQEFPAKEKKEEVGKVLVYGGSSPLGALVVKYVADLGYDVVTTSSNGSREWVERHVPTTVIDHTRASDVVLEELRANGPYTAGIFDAIGTPPVNTMLGKLISSNGGGKYFSVLPPLGGVIPENVERMFVSYHHALTEEKNKELSKWLFEVYIPKGLKNGWVIPSRTRKLEGGLGAAQKAMNMMWEGKTGGNKLIVNPWE